MFLVNSIMVSCNTSDPFTPWGNKKEAVQMTEEIDLLVQKIQKILIVL